MPSGSAPRDPQRAADAGSERRVLPGLRRFRNDENWNLHDLRYVRVDQRGVFMNMPLGVRNDTSNPMADLASVREWALSHIAAHPVPDFHVGSDDDHQLQRWFVLPRNPFQNVYLHRFLRSDDDRALHDHPWDNRSWVLSGEYVEHLQDGSTATRFEGDIVERRAIEAHRVELVTGPAVTLFFTGPVIRNWGFYCPRGWVPWKAFVTIEEGGNRRGQGCE